MRIKMNLEVLPEIRDMMEKETKRKERNEYQRNLRATKKQIKQVQENSKKRRERIKNEVIGEREFQNDSVHRYYKPQPNWPMRLKDEPTGNRLSFSVIEGEERVRRETPMERLVRMAFDIIEGSK